MHTDRSNLTAPFPPGILSLNLREEGAFTTWILTAAKFLMLVDVQVTSGKTWSTAVVGMQWSVTNDSYANAVTFSPTVQFTTSTKSRANIDIASMVYVRFYVVTAEAANDANARIVYMIE